VEQLRAGEVTTMLIQHAHILPVMSEHINRLGRYEFDPDAKSVQTDIRALPLRSGVEIAE
jgi:hypothetical protein